MFRTRRNREGPSRPDASRGSIGTARVWDAHTRALRTSGDEIRQESLPRAQEEPAPSAPGLGPELVASIVRMTLDTCLPSGARGRERAADELRTRLLELLGPPLEPRPTPPTPPANAEPEAGPLLFADLPAQQRALALVLDDRLGRLGGPFAERAELRSHLIILALGSRHELPDAPEASPDEIASLDLLQRRVSKLQGALREARSALEMVSGLEHVDAGIASIYRAVQGLDPRDPQNSSKQGMLQQVFEANLDLQDKRATRGADAG